MAKKTATKATKKTPTKKTAKSAKASPRKKATKSPKKKAATKAGDAEVTVDRRRKNQRTEETAAAENNAAETNKSKADAPKLERRKKVNRRRQIDPTTCERDYSDAEVEFMGALDDYKRSSGRMFPTCSEVLEVIRGLGYVQLSAAEIAARNSDSDLESQAEAEANDALAESAQLQQAADEEAFEEEPLGAFDD